MIDNLSILAEIKKGGITLLLRWFNRRGGNRRLTWAKLTRVLPAFRFPEKDDFKVTSVL